MRGQTQHINFEDKWDGLKKLPNLLTFWENAEIFPEHPQDITTISPADLIAMANYGYVV
jgi:hypothetical protein